MNNLEKLNLELKSSKKIFEITNIRLLLLKLIFLSFMNKLLVINGIKITDKILFCIIPFFLILNNLNNYKYIAKKLSPLIIFIILNFISTLFADYKIISLIFNFNYIFQFMFLLYVINVFQKNIKDYNNILKWLILLATLISIVGILQCIFYPKLESILLIFKEINFRENRATVVFNNPNLLSTFLMTTCIITVFFLKENKKFYLFLFLQVICLILTRSRSGFVFTFIFFTIYFLFENKKNNFLKIIFSIVFLLILYFLIFELKLYFLERIVMSIKALKNLDFKPILNKRYEIYSIAFKLFFENLKTFLIGIGNGNYEIKMMNYSKYVYETHSLYINIICENGILAFCFFIAFLKITFDKKKYIKDKKLRKIFVYTFIFLLINQNFEMHFTHNFYFIYIFWIIVSIPYVFYLKFLEERKNGNSKNFVTGNGLDNRI